MIMGILIGLGFAFAIWVFASGMAEAGKMIIWRDKRYKLVAGMYNHCRHNLNLEHTMNGYNFRACYNCNNVYVDFDDWVKVHYDR